MYNEIEIVSTDFENKYLVRLYDKSMHVGFMIKDIIEFLKEGKASDEMQMHFKESYGLFVDRKTIDDVIENKINPFVIKQDTASFHKIVPLFNPSVVRVPNVILEAFSAYFFYGMGVFVLLINAYFYTTSMKLHFNSTSETILGGVLLFLVVVVHEWGHSLAARRYGTEVKEIGLGWYLVFPVFYVDLNEIWKLNASKRIIINLAGIYLQLFCGVALLVLSMWIDTLKGVFLTVFCINFSIVILNLNPFLKFDGYWVLSDLLQGKDLNKVSNAMVQRWMRFRKTEEGIVMTIYTVLRSVFVLFITLTFLRFLWQKSGQLYASGEVDSSCIFILLVLTLFLYRIVKKRNLKANENII